VGTQDYNCLRAVVTICAIIVSQKPTPVCVMYIDMHHKRQQASFNNHECMTYLSSMCLSLSTTLTSAAVGGPCNF